MSSFFKAIRSTPKESASPPQSLDTIYTLLSLLASEVLLYQISNEKIEEAIRTAFKAFPELLEIESLTALITFDSNYSETSAILSAYTKLRCDIKNCPRKCKVFCKCSSRETYLCNDHIKDHTKLNYEHKINQLYSKVENLQEASNSIQSNIGNIQESIKEVVNFSKEYISNIESICSEQLQCLHQLQSFYTMKLIGLITKNKISVSIHNLNILKINLYPEIFLKNFQKEFLKYIRTKSLLLGFS